MALVCSLVSQATRSLTRPVLHHLPQHRRRKPLGPLMTPLTMIAIARLWITTSYWHCMERLMFDKILAYWLPQAQQREAERAAQAEQAAYAAQAQAEAEERQRAYDHLRHALTETFGVDVWWLYPHVTHTRTHPVAVLSDSGILLWQADGEQWRLQRGMSKPRVGAYTQHVFIPHDLPPAVALDRLIVSIHTFAQRLAVAACPPVCPSCNGTGWGAIADCATCNGTGFQPTRRRRW